MEQTRCVFAQGLSCFALGHAQNERTDAMIQTKVMNSGAIMGPLYFVTAGALFAGANTAVQAAGMGFGVPSATIAFWQYALASLIVIPMVWNAPWRSDRPLAHLLRVGLAAIGVQFWVAGLAVVPIWQAVALILTSPLFVTLGAWLFLGERMTLPRVLAVLVGGIGGAIILAPWADAFQLAALLPVGAAAFWAASSVVTKELTKSENAGTLTLALLVLLVPINGVAAISSGFAVTSEALWLVALSGLLIAAAQYLIAKAYMVADAAYLQPFDHLKLPLNVGLGIIFFGFAPPGMMWIGAAVIIGASAWVMKDEAG
jgi:S-adenosylmethionine uptake transporter